MFSPTAQEYIANPGKTGPLDAATHHGRLGNPGDGPYVLIWLVVDASGVITDVSQQTNGCPTIIACASLAARLLKGRTLEQARRLEPEDLVMILGSLPEGKGDCPRMVVNALAAALGGTE